MFKLERGNVVKIVATEQEREKLKGQGFVEIAEAKEDNTVEGGQNGKNRKAKTDSGN